MPKKVRELKAMVAKVGYILQAKRGKGSHTYWKHPLLPGEPLTIPGKDGDDAPPYLEKAIQQVLKKLEELENLEREDKEEGEE
jgi:predicted RNA binding protein YcfA (HicA-like mRNA interferase family)